MKDDKFTRKWGFIFHFVKLFADEYIDDLDLPILTSPPEESITTALSILSWPDCQGQCFHTDRVYIHGFGEKKL